MVKLCFIGIYFSYFYSKNIIYGQKYEKYQSFFYLKNFQFLEVKFSIHLNRRVFVMHAGGEYPDQL